MSQAFESVLKASHINVTKSIAEAHGGQMLMQSSMFDRLGRSSFRASLLSANFLSQELAAKPGSTANSSSSATLGRLLQKT